MSTTASHLPHALRVATDFIDGFAPAPGDDEGQPEGFAESLEVAGRMLSPNLDAARSALSTDDDFTASANTLSVHLNVDVVDALLVARGWTIERYGAEEVARAGRPDSEVGTARAFIAPDGARYWHRDEALTIALTAEGLAAHAPAPSAPDVDAEAEADRELADMAAGEAAEDAERLRKALADFQNATSQLNAVWQDFAGDAIDDYPESLPSFDEFACEVSAMRVREGR